MPNIKPERRNPDTACCWHCGVKYHQTYEDNGGIWGHCAPCDSIQGIVAPSLNKEKRNG